MSVDPVTGAGIAVDRLTVRAITAEQLATADPVRDGRLHRLEWSTRPVDELEVGGRWVVLGDLDPGLADPGLAGLDGYGDLSALLGALDRDGVPAVVLAACRPVGAELA